MLYINLGWTELFIWFTGTTQECPTFTNKVAEKLLKDLKDNYFQKDMEDAERRK